MDFGFHDVGCRIGREACAKRNDGDCITRGGESEAGEAGGQSLRTEGWRPLFLREGKRARDAGSGTVSTRHHTPGVDGPWPRIVERRANRQHHPLARVWEGPVANPNLCEQDRPVNRARSANRVHAVLGGGHKGKQVATKPHSDC